MKKPDLVCCTPVKINGVWYHQSNATAPKIEAALCNLLEWAKGNRGSKQGNPYCIPEVKAALKTLAELRGRSDWLDVDTTMKGLCLRGPTK